MKHHHGSRRRRVSVHGFLLICAIFSGLGLLILTWRSIDLTIGSSFPFDVSRKLHKHQDQSFDTHLESSNSSSPSSSVSLEATTVNRGGSVSCATVEEMGEEFAKDELGEGNRMLRRKIQRHFALNGAPRVRELPPEQFCRHGFVLGKSAEAGFGNEMYKILSGAALSIMLNRSLIIGQTRGRFPFGEYISYTNLAFTLKEVKHLWRQNDCLGKYGKRLIMRTDDFEKPAETNVLCSNWKEWTQPIIWFQGTNDGAAIQFFLKNVHLEMRNAASGLFGQPEFLSFRPNVFGELMRVIISPSKDVEEAVNWTLNGQDPDITLHTRMLMNRSVRAIRAALNCLKKAVRSYRHKMRRPRIVLVSDTPSFVKDLAPELEEFAEVLHFDYKLFSGNISSVTSKAAHQLEFRVKDWGPAPRWVAFVDFFLASRAKHAVVSGAHRRVGTTYAQLIAALAAANHLRKYTFPPSYMTHRLQDIETVNPFSAGERKTSKFSFFSSFQSNLLSDGLGNQIGWGHVWNRFAGPLSCHNQPNQCAATPLLPPAWWDGTWQSPIPRDIRRLATFGVQLSSFGQVNESHLRSFCSNRKTVVKTARVFQKCQDGNC